MRRLFSKKAFTFIETVLAVVVVGAIAGVAAKVLTSGLDVYSLIVNRHDASQTARLAMERMVDEILMVDSSEITWMADNRFGFRDVDGVSTNFKSYTVSKNGLSVPCIYRDEDFLAGNVIYLDFDYLKSDGTSTIWAPLVRLINIDFTVEAPANAGSIHLRTNVFPRSFMYSNFE